MPEVREPLFSEQLHVMVPVGTLAAVRSIARQEGQTTSEFVRAAIKAQLRRTSIEKRDEVRNDQRDNERYTATGPQISERNDLHVINDAEWRRRLKSWVEMGVWRENWGGGPPEPGDAPGPDCAISAAVLNEWHNGLIDFSKIEFRRTQQAE